MPIINMTGCISACPERLWLGNIFLALVFYSACCKKSTIIVMVPCRYPREQLEKRIRFAQVINSLGGSMVIAGYI